MRGHVPPPSDEWDGLHLEADSARVLEALEDDAARQGMRPVDPATLVPLSRAFDGEESRGVCRYVVAPPVGKWTSVLPSDVDHDHEWAPRISAKVGCRAAYLMLHDGDVLTLHLYDRGELVAAHVSSPEHFDQPPRRPDDLARDVGAILPACRPGTTEAELLEALTPPGRLDVDGAEAFRRVARLMGLPESVATSYRLATGTSGVLQPELAGHVHVAFRSSADLAELEAADDEAEELEDTSETAPEAGRENDGNVVPFRRPGSVSE